MSTRTAIQKFLQQFCEIDSDDFHAKRQVVELSFLRQGITFNVYGNSCRTERIFPLV